MERMTLREAAGRTSRSVTTLRRYIRSGRLAAEKLVLRLATLVTVTVYEPFLADFAEDLAP